MFSPAYKIAEAVKILPYYLLMVVNGVFHPKLYFLIFLTKMILFDFKSLNLKKTTDLSSELHEKVMDFLKQR